MKKLLFIVVILMLLIFIKNTAVSIIGLSQNSKTVNNLNTDLESAKHESIFLQQKLLYVKSDDFIEKQAREKLNLVKNGEYVVLAPKPDEKAQEKPVDEIPNWKKWLKLFF